MSSLRLALKQSLEETSATTPPPPPPPPPAVQGMTMVGRTSPHHATAAGATTTTAMAPGSGSVTSYHTEEDSTSPVLKKRGPGRPRKYPRPPGEQPRKRGRPRKHPPASGDEDAFSSENEFSVGEGGETEHNHEEGHHRVSAASKIQSHWKKSKGKPFALERSEVSEPPGATAGNTKTDTQQSPRNDSGNVAASTTEMTNQSNAVAPPTLELIEWMRSMPQKRARKAVHPGLRVKVRFVTNTKVKKDGKVIRKRIWYGGRITAVSKEGSKIKIKYDDKTSEVTQFPDKDVVIDDSFNGKHHAKADKFIPPAVDAGEEIDDGEELFGESPEDEEDQHHATKPTRTKDTHHHVEEPKPKAESTATLSSSKVISLEVAQPKVSAEQESKPAPVKPEGSLKSISQSFSEMSPVMSESKGHLDNQPTKGTITQPEKTLQATGKEPLREATPHIESLETPVSSEAAKHENSVSLAAAIPSVEEKPTEKLDISEKPQDVAPLTSGNIPDIIGKVLAPTKSLPEPLPKETEPPKEIPEKKEESVESAPQNEEVPSVDLGKHEAIESTPADVAAEPMEIEQAETSTAGLLLPKSPAESNVPQPMEVEAEPKPISELPAKATQEAPASETKVPETPEKTHAEPKAAVPMEESTPVEPKVPKVSPSQAAVQSFPSDEKRTIEEAATDSPKETEPEQKASEQPDVANSESNSPLDVTTETSSVNPDNSTEAAKLSEPKDGEFGAHKKSPATEVTEPDDDAIAESKPDKPNKDSGSKSSPAEEAPTTRMADTPEHSEAEKFGPVPAADVDPHTKETSEEPTKPKRKRGRPPKHRPPADGSSQDKIILKADGSTPVPASSMESEMSLDTSDRSDSKDKKSTNADDTKGAAKQTLTIRIPNLKKASTKTGDKDVEPTGDSVGAKAHESPRGKKRPPSSVEGGEPPTKRLHIHIGSKGSQESLSDLGDKSDKISGGGKHSKSADAALSPRPKKVKRKREREIDSTPRIAASKPGKKYVEKNESTAEGPGVDPSSQEIGEHKISGSGDDGAGTPDARSKADSQSAARLGRRAAQQANERISSKNDLPPDLAAKKKKKKRRDMDEAEAGRDVEIPAFQWVQCDKCAKWRIIPSSVVEALPPLWYCANNKWDPKRASCEAPEQTPKQVAKERKRKKRKLMMEREAAQAAERGEAPTEDAAEASTSPRNSDDAVDAQRASPSEHSLDSGHGTDGQKEKKGVVSNKKPKTPTVVDVPPVAEEEPKPRGRGRPRRNPPKEASTPSAPSNSAPPATDEADNLEWVQCEKCDKWRKLPPHISADELPDVWYCSMNTWNPGSASCSAPEDKADGLQDIFNNNAASGKLSYRNLIFGSNGRKHNRPISERTRAAESLFAAVSDDCDAPSAVMYANSSAFICRGKLNSQSDENDAPTVLDLMTRSHLWTELEKSQPKSAVPLLFDALSTQARESMKDIVLHCLGDQTMTGEQLHERVRDRDWESAPLGWAAVRKYCSENMIVMAMCDLVKMGVLECFRVDGPFPNGQLWTLCYRRANAHGVGAPAAAVSPEADQSDTGSRRCMKFAKPWKRAQSASS
uniref:CW-type domain-containing protein n=1 Tax=Amphora coffeiformis TaxID=265554 RepID=A0A7S3P6X2_9STRA